MKTKAILLLLVFFALMCGKTQAQAYTPFPDSNAVWYELTETYINYPDTTQYQTKLYGIFDDTLINNQLYKKLYLNDGLIDSTIQLSSPNTVYFCALRQDTALKKVYFIPKDSLNELVLYDFGVNVGDTIFVYNEWGAKVKGWCYCKGPTMIGGKNRNTICIQTFNIHSFFHICVEGVGNIRGLFETFYEFSSNKAVSCLTINDSLYYKFDGNFIWGILLDTNFYSECYNNGYIITVDAASHNVGQEINIFPNPFSNITHITFSEYFQMDNVTIDIYDIHGKQVMSIKEMKSHQITLNKADFRISGIYLIKVNNHKQMKIFKLIIL